MNFVKRLTFALIVLFPAIAQAEVHVVATLPALGQVAKAVVGEDGEVRVLARVGEDPHFVPPKPTLARHLARTDLLVTAGLALESGWLPPLIELSRNGRIRQGQPGHFAGSDHVAVIGADRVVDRSMGDVHPDGNPHWWLDPIRMAEVAVALGKRMEALDPENGAAYRRRAEAFATQLHELVSRWRTKFVQSPPVITYHDSYRYFIERFGIRVAGFIEPKPGVEPSTRHLDGLLETMKKTGVVQVWVEPYHHGRIAERVASLSGAGLVVMPDAVEGEGAECYLALIRMLLRSAAGVPR